MNFLSPIILNGNELRSAVLQNLATTPSGAKPGQVWFSTSGNAAYVWNGTVARPLDAALLTDGSIQIAALATNPLQRANHTGTQLAATISNLQTTVTGYTLDTFAAPAATVNGGGQRYTGLANATAATDAVPLAQVNNLIASAVAGQTAVKNPARAYAASNVSLSGLQTIDGVALGAGDRVLVANQTTASQNGLYAAASGAWSLVPDASSASQWTEGTDLLIAEGSNYAGAIFRQATLNPTITTLTFVQTAKVVNLQGDGSSIAVTGTTISAILGNGLKNSGSAIVVDPAITVRKFNGTITTDGSTSSFQFTHGLGTANCHVTMRDGSGNQIFVDNAVTSTTATIAFGSAPASGSTYSVTVTG